MFRYSVVRIDRIPQKNFTFFSLECLEYFLYHFLINAYPTLLAKAQCSRYVRYFPPKA